MTMNISTTFLLFLLTTGAPLSSSASSSCSGQSFRNVPGVSGGCVSSSHDGLTCIQQQGSLQCLVDGKPLQNGSGPPAGTAARAVLHKKESNGQANNDYGSWASTFPASGGGSVTPNYSDYQSGYMGSTVVGDGGNGQMAREYSQAMSFQGSGNANTNANPGQQQGGYPNGGAWIGPHRQCEDDNCYRNRNLAETETKGDAAEAAEKDNTEGVRMDWAAVGLQGDCSAGCVANIYDTSDCTDDSLRPLSPLASVTYFTNENDMSAGNATLPGTVEDYVGKALLFHNDANGEFNVDNGLDACGIFELVDGDVDVKEGDAADGTATSTSPATSLTSVLPFLAAAGIFFIGSMLL
mmetsp:Transcript_27109/g.63395  ORF Transcript_27109/g.63395 Transcript_27109/m.63395 type:complete len:352 (-) Transcript_27109:1775-2830(-)